MSDTPDSKAGPYLSGHGLRESSNWSHLAARIRDSENALNFKLKKSRFMVQIYLLLYPYDNIYLLTYIPSIHTHIHTHTEFTFEQHGD